MEIVLLNPYSEPDSPGDKLSIMDIKAKTTNGQLINIELQLFNPSPLISWISLS
jgi:hypothetical protein